LADNKITKKFRKNAQNIHQENINIL